MKILKDTFKEEMEAMEEPFNPEDAPEPTSEEIPGDDLSEDMPMPEEEPIIEEDVGIDPADSFYPPNEDYDYAPDVMLTGNPNDGIKYPAGGELEPEMAVDEPIPEGDLGIQEKKERRMSKVTKKAVAVAKAKRNILEAKKLMKEFDMGAEDEFDIETPPVDGEEMMGDDVEMGEEGMEEPETEADLVQDILADAEELYNKLVGEDEVPAEEDLEMPMGEEGMEGEVPVDSDEMLEAKKARKKALTENIKAKIARRKLKENIKAKIATKRALKEGVEEKVADDMHGEDLDDGVLDSIYEGNGKAEKAFNEAMNHLGASDKYKKIAWKAILESYKADTTNQASPQKSVDPNISQGPAVGAYTPDSTKGMDNGPITKGDGTGQYKVDTTPEMPAIPAGEKPGAYKVVEGIEDDLFFEEAQKRSRERKAYLANILKEEDTPIMSDQSDVEDLMGLKILKKMGEDPKLVESTSKKFIENYKEKKSFDFKRLLENGFLG